VIPAVAAAIDLFINLTVVNSAVHNVRRTSFCDKRHTGA